MLVQSESHRNGSQCGVLTRGSTLDNGTLGPTQVKVTHLLNKCDISKVAVAAGTRINKMDNSSNSSNLSDDTYIGIYLQ